MGEIVSAFSYSHEVYGEGFYMVEVSVHRLSSFVDYIPVMVSERLVNVQESAEGKCVYITGQFRSFNRHEEHKNRLVLSVFAREFELVEQFEEENAANQIFLDGFICKESVYRKTPLGREIADLLVAVNRSYGKSDYIPCICWGRNARFASRFEVGSLQKHKRELQIGQEGWEILTSAAGAFYGESSAENLRCNEICRKRMEKFLAESRLEFFKKQRVYLPVGMLTGVVMIILLV